MTASGSCVDHKHRPKTGRVYGARLTDKTNVAGAGRHVPFTTSRGVAQPAATRLPANFIMVCLVIGQLIEKLRRLSNVGGQ